MGSISIQKGCATPLAATTVGQKPVADRMSVKRSPTWVGTAAARSGRVQRRPSWEAEHVNQARRACGSKVVSYQHAHSAPVVESAVAAGKSCCVLPSSGGFT